MDWLYCIVLYCIVFIYLPQDYNYKKIQKNVGRNGEEGQKETIKLTLIRPPQLQFFKDGIKIITAKEKKYYQSSVAQRLEHPI